MGGVQKGQNLDYVIFECPLDDGVVPAVNRLLSIAFVFSPTQPTTPGDGNCFLHAIMDQLR